ncbi:DUF6233 domain-containing protein [Streptomyces sp. NPDC005727]|uniref:DUF6233 domain-containing protein n=1 Tax=unclassified Streptomyces TaxID=2593676 RepID=UPI003406F9D1
MAGKRRRPVEQDEARRLLADGTSACPHCRPDTGLGIVDLRQGSASDSVRCPRPILKRV